MKAMQWMVVVCMVGLWVGAAGANEKLDPGLVGLRDKDGSVYLGWRMLSSDADHKAFNVYRQTADGKAECLTKEPVAKSTNFVDVAAPKDGKTAYFVKPVVDGKEGEPSKSVSVADTSPGDSFVRIKFKGDYIAQKAAIADLDGDGQYDYVIKQPEFSTDPWDKIWKKSPGTYKLEAYKSDGTFLWQYDMGWAIEMGVWYSPYVVYDLDGDGKAEVYVKGGEGDPRDADGRVTTGPEWVMQLDGLTGQVLRKADWPDRSGYPQYNLGYSRNIMGIAYLDGKTPSLIVIRGTYNLIKVTAYDAELNVVWQWNSQSEKQRYDGSGMHGMHAADVDGDGRDEIILGSAVLDDNGRGLWTNPMHSTVLAHPDVCYVGDIDPANPGMEIFYGFETSQPRDGLCLVDAKTGKMLWSYDGPTEHIHGQGMVGDITAEYPGQECYGQSRDGQEFWLYAANGTRIGKEPISEQSPHPVYWDADPQKEIAAGGKRPKSKGTIFKYKGQTYQTIEGKVLAIADCLGDWREEIITSLPGELRIYTTTIPAQSKRPCLMQDRLYRLEVAKASMGYFYPPQHSGK